MIADEVLAAVGTLLSVIHPQTVILPTASLGREVIVQRFTTVSTRAVVAMVFI